MLTMSAKELTTAPGLRKTAGSASMPGTTMRLLPVRKSKINSHFALTDMVLHSGVRAEFPIGFSDGFGLCISALVSCRGTELEERSLKLRTPPLRLYCVHPSHNHCWHRSQSRNAGNRAPESASRCSPKAGGANLSPRAVWPPAFPRRLSPSWQAEPSYGGTFGHSGGPTVS